MNREELYGYGYAEKQSCGMREKFTQADDIHTCRFSKCQCERRIIETFADYWIVKV